MVVILIERKGMDDFLVASGYVHGSMNREKGQLVMGLGVNLVFAAMVS